MKQRAFVYEALVLLLLAVGTAGEPVSAAAPSPGLQPVDLRCEYAKNPLGIDSPTPLLGWRFESSARNQRQLAYQVLVATSPEQLLQDGADLWDSGRVQSGESAHVAYAGKPLTTRLRCWWKVRVWDQEGVVSAWSEPSNWEMGLLAASDWQAKWIGSGPTYEPRPTAGFITDKKELAEFNQPVDVDSRSTLLRKEFVVGKTIQRARMYVTGLGYYELSCNGKRVGDRVLAPAKSNYRKWVLYDVYDVTGELKQGANAVGMMLGNGWFNPAQKWWEPYRMQWFGSKRGILQLHIDYTDGSRETVISDGSWKTAPGAVMASCVYDGESYDARQEQAGWDSPAFDDAQWAAANVVEPPGGALKAHVMPPIKVVEHIRPVSVSSPKEGSYVFDMGQNFAGWARLTLTGTRGTRITLRYAEDLNADGTIDVKSNERALATDVYILKGGGPEVYEPRFTFHGFRYVEVTGFPGTPDRDALLGCVVHSACESVGEFTCDNELINRIHAATRWSQRSNLMGYPMDCPQRDERLGWFGDAMVSMEEAMFNFDLPLFYRQWLDGVQLNQNESNGDISIVSPRPYMSLEPDPTWSSAYVVMVWEYYRHYGDKQFLARHFESMRRYVDYLGRQAKDHIVPKYWIGDWGTIVKGWQEGEPVSVTTAFYYYDTMVVAMVARELGKEEDAEKYAALAGEIKAAFNRRYFDATKKRYEQGTQFSNAFPLYLGLAEPNDRRQVLEGILLNLQQRRGHFDVGVLGAKYLVDALTNAGRADVAYGLATKTGFPSWAHMLEAGRTTLSEFWDLHGSHNHVMMGSIDGWFYRTLAGIRPTKDGAGFAHVIVKPFVPAGLNYVKASTRTVQGTVAVEWRKAGDGLNLKVRIPANSTATIHVPAKSAAQVRSEAPLDAVRTVDNGVVYEVGSGEYGFRVDRGDSRDSH